MTFSAPAFDPLSQRYPSARFPIYARGGMVNTSSPLASFAGLEMLRKGGNAIDAAVATAAALTVVEPTDNGIGGDAFAIVWAARDQTLYGLNCSGPAPALISIERVLAREETADGKMPCWGWAPVTVPGAVKAWSSLSARFGRLPFPELLKPAISYAREGYPVSPNLSRDWDRLLKRYQAVFTRPCFTEWFRTFAPEGTAPLPGQMVTLRHHADTLEEIGRTNGDSFYRGVLAQKIDRVSREEGGFLRFEDLASFEPSWVEPVRLPYRGYEVCELPPNGQGIVTLIALNILKEFSFSSLTPAETAHRQLEAMKIAFADALDTITDPVDMPDTILPLLEPAYGRKRAAQIGPFACVRRQEAPPRGGTVYLCCADGEGNMVSYIQSNYMSFGSGIVIKDTGIALQNRGADFSLDPTHANHLAPGKRCYHTIIPGFLMKEGHPVGPFGVMGGYMQPQGHLQVVMNYVDFHMNPQQALDAPRWQWMRDNTVTVENRFDPAVMEQLKQMGHKIRQDPFTPSFGRGQMIVRLSNGVLAGGTESRTDSNIACF